MYEVDEVGGGSGGSGGCPYESPMYESPIHKRTPRAGSMADRPPSEKFYIDWKFLVLNSAFVL